MAMARRDFFPRFPAREWLMRGALAVTAAVVGSFSVAHTVAQSVVMRDPALAHALAPWDGRFTAALAASLSTIDATPAERTRADALAAVALRQDATAVAAASTLGLNAQLRGDAEGARRSFTYAEKLSRRDLQTQIWFIENAVVRGDVRGALHHYDIALRTRPESWELLFPVLTAASASPDIRASLIQTLAARPLWTDAFVGHIVAKGDDPKTTAALLAGLRRASVPVPESAHAGTIAALIASGNASDAWAHYAAIRSGADRRRSRDPRFTAEHEVPSAFDWNPLADGGVVAVLQPASGGGMFEFNVPASMGGPLLRQAQMLPGGTYRIEGHSNGIERAAGAEPYWALTCQADGRELGRVVVPNSARNEGRYSGSFTVPGGCAIQDLTLVARASDVVTGASGQIDFVTLAPAS